MERIRVIDSHTGGEPTRVIVEGGPELGDGPLDQRRERFRAEFDHIRSAVVNEPRGNDAIVGALFCPPVDQSCLTGVIFFNNVGYIGMCVHGTIGVAVTLAYLGRASVGEMRLETPVGIVSARLEEDGKVTVGNVPSYRWRSKVPIDVPGYGKMHGDIAWGGNWFFLVSDHRQQVSYVNRERLTDCCLRIRETLQRDGITGEDGEIDHIELFAPPESDSVDSRNFVLCPGGAYDRSPCGTGTSAKVACLMADGTLMPRQEWRQEGIVGSIFEAWGEVEGERIRPFVRGWAHVNAEATLLLDAADPFCHGIAAPHLP